MRRLFFAASILAACSSDATNADPAPVTPPTPAPAPDASGSLPGPSDAGVADADAGRKGCTALFCEDFEKGTLDPARWKPIEGYDPANKVTVQSAKVAHGTYAAQAHVGKTGGFAFIEEKETFPALAAGLWARVYLYISVDKTIGHHAFSKISNFEVGESQETVQLTFYPPGGGEKPVGYENAKVPHDAWTCVEWHVSTTSPQVELYVAGTSIAKYENGPTDTIPPLTALTLGIDTHVATPSAVDVWIDDVAIDANRVGCLP